MFGWVEKREDGKWGRKTEREIWFSIVQLDEKGQEIEWDWMEFSTTIFSPSKLGRKEERKWQWEKSTKLFPLFHTSTFNNKGIIEIYFLSFHFSILPTKHTWWKTKQKYFLSSQYFQSFPFFHLPNQTEPNVRHVELIWFCGLHGVFKTIG